jgi:hypothetical protein
MSGIEKKYINASLVAGSSDILRNNVGGNWSVIEEEDDNSVYQFNSVDLENINGQYITKIVSQPENAQSINEDAILPNFIYPVRIASNGEWDLGRAILSWSFKLFCF